MNRRRLFQTAFASTVVAVLPGVTHAQETPESTPESDEGITSIVEFMDVDGEGVENAYATIFTNDGANFTDIMTGSLLVLFSVGVQLRPGESVKNFVDGAYTSYVEWLVDDNNPSMSAGNSRQVSVGRDAPGDDALAWVLDVSDTSEDPPWDEFQFACTAVWQGQKVQLMWGTTATGAPTIELLEIASSSLAHWEASDKGILPELNDLPAGMTEFESPKEITHLFKS